MNVKKLLALYKPRLSLMDSFPRGVNGRRKNKLGPMAGTTRRNTTPEGVWQKREVGSVALTEC